MPPNLSSSLALFLRNSPTSHEAQLNPVRTEFVVQNIYSHLLKDEYYVQKLQPYNWKEQTVLTALENLVDAFQRDYSVALSNLTASLKVTLNTFKAVILGVSNELFCEGIDWSKIITFLVFIGEFAKQCHRKDLPEYVTTDILHHALMYMRNNLQKWIDDHGSWEGIIEFSRRILKNNIAKKPNVWNSNIMDIMSKTAVTGANYVWGTLSNIVSYTDAVFGFYPGIFARNKH